MSVLAADSIGSEAPRTDPPPAAPPAGAEASRNQAVALSMASNMASLGIAAGASIVVARLLGPVGRGQLAAIVVWSTLAAALGDLGVSQACGYYSAKRPREAGIIAGTAMAVTVCAGAILMLTIQLLAGRIFDREVAGAARYYLLSVPFSMATTSLAAMMLGRGSFGRFNLIKTAQAAGYAAGMISAWAVGSAHVGGILNGILLFHVAVTGVALRCAASAIPLAAWRTSGAMAKDLLSYGIRAYAGNICWLANGRLDQALLVWLAPMRELGIYAVAVSYSGLLFGVSGAVATVAFSRTARARSGEARRQELWRSLGLLAVLTVPLSILMSWPGARLIPAVYGPGFRTASGPARILLVGALFLGVNYVLSNYMRADGRPGGPVWAEAIGLMVTVVSLPFAIPRWGITGAAWVSVASYATTAASLAVLRILYGASHRRRGRAVREDGRRSEVSFS